MKVYVMSAVHSRIVAVVDVAIVVALCCVLLRRLMRNRMLWYPVRKRSRREMNALWMHIWSVGVHTWLRHL